MSNYYRDFSPLDMSISIITDKKRAARNEAVYMLMRLQEMFEYEGLPETIPKDYLEYYRMIYGQCFITEVKGELYALTGYPGGEPDPYYRPTRYVVANPALKFSADLDIVKDGVLMRNDWGWFGLAPMLSKYSVLLAENFLTIRVTDVMLRAMAMLSAPDDKTRVAAELFLKKLEKGELGVIGETPFFDGIRMQSPPSNNGSYLTQFIELHQFIRGALFQELGIDSLTNAKREALSEGETHLNEGTLLPLVDHMLRVREEDNERLNAMYGLNVTVKLSSSWKLLRDNIEMANELAKEGADETSGTDEVLSEQVQVTESTREKQNDERGSSESEEVGVCEDSSGEEDVNDMNSVNELVEVASKALDLANELATSDEESGDTANELDTKEEEKEDGD